ncbi:MAG: hypothetical protein FWH27_11850 [Planctomycetaceae bacterium]|nr:hypothetical protein [Planctomycetaceae bacterium]
MLRLTKPCVISSNNRRSRRDRPANPSRDGHGVVEWVETLSRFDRSMTLAALI